MAEEPVPPPRQEAPPHTMEQAAVLARYGTSLHGLSRRDAAELLARLGANELRQAATRSPLAIFVAQFQNFLVGILVGAALLSAFLDEVGDCVAIVVILVLNGTLGFIQEYRAEQAMAALCRMSPPKARIVREGQELLVPAADLVPGDMVVLDAGAVVPADLRLVSAHTLRINESTLTGESEPVEKNPSPLEDSDLPLGDRRNIAYMGTVATYGRGHGVVFATGMRTELGRIAAMLDEHDHEPTPLQRRLEQLGKTLGVVALVICALLAGVGIARGEAPLVMLMTAVSLAVAAIPEALPAVVTIALALGAARMVKNKALIRKLPAVETLGAVTVICSDKTGTLTQNRMLVRRLWTNEGDLAVTGRGYEPAGAFQVEGSAVVALSGRPGAVALIEALALCSDSSLIPPMGELRDWGVTGDPTEGALVALAAKAGLQRKALGASHPRVGELPFDSERKMMTTLHRDEARSVYFSATKGGLDVVLPRCVAVRADGRDVPLDDAWRQRILAASDDMARLGYRVLVGARREHGAAQPAPTEASLEQGLTFLGFVGIQDPPRETVPASVAQCRSAGIRLIMITGDHPLTAAAIAREIGMVDGEPAVLTGRELADLTEEELAERVKTVQVFARVSPEHKLKIIAALRRHGHIVAMTGDGVNDAPALKEADIGVAMGIQGTDVTKEAADLILLDDNFSTIVSAVRDGRRIYENIRKFVRFVIAGNTGEIWTMVLAPLLGLPLPLAPIQILWVNLVTDGLPGLALAVEPAEGDIMRQRPRDPQEAILSGRMGYSILFNGLLIGLLCVAAHWFMLSGTAHTAADVDRARAVVFSLLCGLQLANALSVRCERESSLAAFFRNGWLLAAVGACALAQVLVVSVPTLSAVFKVSPLSAGDVALVALASTTVFWTGELEKVWARFRARQ